MTATIDLTVQPVATEPVTPAPQSCPLARLEVPRPDGCQHPSGSCKPEGCSAC